MANPHRALFVGTFVVATCGIAIGTLSLYARPHRAPHDASGIARVACPSAVPSATSRVVEATPAVAREPRFVPAPAVAVPQRGYRVELAGFSDGHRWAMFSGLAGSTTVFVETESGAAQAFEGASFFTRLAGTASAYALGGERFAPEHAHRAPVTDALHRYAVGTRAGSLYVYDLEQHAFAELGPEPRVEPALSPEGDSLAWRCEDSAVCAYRFEARSVRRVALPAGLPDTLHWEDPGQSRTEPGSHEWVTLTRSVARWDESSYGFSQGANEGPAATPREDGAPDAALVNTRTGAIETYSVDGADVVFLERSADGRYVAARLSPAGVAVFRAGERSPLVRRDGAAGRWLWRREGGALVWMWETLGRGPGDAEARARGTVHVEWLDAPAQVEFEAARRCGRDVEHPDAFEGDEVRTRLGCERGHGAVRYEGRAYDARTGALSRRLAPRDDASLDESRRAGDGAFLVAPLRRPRERARVYTFEGGIVGVVQTARAMTLVQHRLGVAGVDVSEFDGVSDGLAWSVLASHQEGQWLGVHRDGSAAVWGDRSGWRVWSSAPAR